MKKVLLFILLILSPMLASADAVEIDGIWYNLINKVKEAEVTNNPNGYNSSSIEIPTSVSYNEMNYSVTSIGESAFSGCYALASVTIPNSVKSIGNHAFSGCSNLTSITIPNNVKSIETATFWNCSGLTSVSIPNGVTYIGGSAFSNCSNLTSITIPNSVTSIDASAFNGCSGLTSITIPNSVTSIGNYAFWCCSGLTSITIPNSVTSIGEQTFGNCNDLTVVYCMAEILKNNSWGDEGLYTHPDAFKKSYPQAMTLHVPASAINAYKTTEPWSGFKEIVPISEEQIQKCATPTISVENGKVKFKCETEGVEYVSIITAPDAKNYYDSELTLAYKYTVSVYATKNGYINSDTATLEITASGIVGDVNKDGEVNVADQVTLTEIIMNK